VFKDPRTGRHEGRAQSGRLGGNVATVYKGRYCEPWRNAAIVFDVPVGGVRVFVTDRIPPFLYLIVGHEEASALE
jgi:hypothetical protein